MTLALVASKGVELLIPVLVLGGVAFWAWMLADCATKEKDQNLKIVWLIFIAITGLLGAPLYFFMRKLPRRSRSL